MLGCAGCAAFLEVGVCGYSRDVYVSGCIFNENKALIIRVLRLNLVSLWNIWKGRHPGKNCNSIMDAILCKHEVHQVQQEAGANYELALSIVRSLMADINEGTAEIFQATKPGMPAPEFFKGAGGLEAYEAVWQKLRQWERTLCRQAGIPEPDFEEEITECC